MMHRRVQKKCRGVGGGGREGQELLEIREIEIRGIFVRSDEVFLIYETF